MAGKGGSRPGAGRKKKEAIPEAESKGHAIELLAALNRPADKTDSEEVNRWRKLTEAQDLKIVADTSKYLDDKAHGRSIQTVNHVHDKPIEVNHNFQLSLEIKEARERAAKK